MTENISALCQLKSASGLKVKILYLGESNSRGNYVTTATLGRTCGRWNFQTLLVYVEAKAQSAPWPTAVASTHGLDFLGGTLHTVGAKQDSSSSLSLSVSARGSSPSSDSFFTSVTKQTHTFIHSYMLDCLYVMFLQKELRYFNSLPQPTASRPDWNHGIAYSSCRACDARCLPSCYSPVSSGLAPGPCTSSGLVHGKPPAATTAHSKLKRWKDISCHPWSLWGYENKKLTKCIELGCSQKLLYKNCKRFYTKNESHLFSALALIRVCTCSKV